MFLMYKLKFVRHVETCKNFITDLQLVSKMLFVFFARMFANIYLYDILFS